MPGDGLEAYASALLTQLLGKAEAEIGNGERATINGLPALIVPAIVRTEQGPVELTIAAYEGEGRSAWHFLIAAPPSEQARPAVRALIGSFRLLPPAEVATLRPRTIRTVAVAPGETAQTLAARMATENRLDHFLMLNGRSADQPLRPGERVKIVAWGR
jgi:predicted Zn-dependent protease